ncbi:MAG: hypothetical protein HY241_09650 [Actinobacteria bacterium]|nr:hypothetical protein [Actinomycetota bacterium]
MSHQPDELVRHYVTYFDFNYLGPATAAVPSFLRTHDFDRLTLLTPGIDPFSSEAEVMAQVLTTLKGLDPRVEHVDVAEVTQVGRDADLEAAVEFAKEQSAWPESLAMELLRACLYPWAGHPVVWFDGDMLFVGDTSGVFSSPHLTSGAAAPDVLSTSGEASGLHLYRRFVRHVAAAGGGPMHEGVGRNIGFVVLAKDVRASLAQGLRLAADFVKDEQDPVARYILGQLAWNYVFERHQYATLDQRYNVPTQPLPPASADDRNSSQVLVRHYIGPEQKKRMIIDLLHLHGGFGPGGR